MRGQGVQHPEGIPVWGGLDTDTEGRGCLDRLKPCIFPQLRNYGFVTSYDMAVQPDHTICWYLGDSAKLSHKRWDWTHHYSDDCAHDTWTDEDGCHVFQVSTASGTVENVIRECPEEEDACTTSGATEMGAPVG